MSTKISTTVQTIKENYQKSIRIVDGLHFKQWDVIRMIEFYSNSKYLSGQKDELGRVKRFYQILNGMCDMENAGKDIDTKDITATSDDGQHYVESFLMTKDIYEWMKGVNFGKILNDMRDTHTRYGSLLVKKCIKKDEDGNKILSIELPEWKNVITDQVDILGSPIIEVHPMTPLDLSKMENVWDKASVRKVLKKASEGGNILKRIPVYEVRGEFPLSFFKEVSMKKQGYDPTPKDERTFTYQLYYFAGEASDFDMDTTSVLSLSDKLTPLYWENETEKVYKYLARKKKAGRAFGVGVMEEGEEAQAGTNDAVLKQGRAMEITSKAIGQSASKKLKGRNTFTEVDDGQILEIEENKPILPLNMIPAGGLGQYQNLITQWYSQLEKVTSGYAAQRGETPPSGTPFRLQATILQQSSSVLVDLQEELGIFITEIFNDWVMPYLAKQLNAEHILSHEFSMDELKEIDKNFAIRSANEEAKRRFLSGGRMTLEQYLSFVDSSEKSVQQTKTQRFLKLPKNYYKGFKAKITVNVTGEQRNKAAVLESLINIMTVYEKNPAIAQDPVLMQIFLKIVELSGAGISPVTLMGAITEQAQKATEQAVEPETETPEQNPALSLAAKGGKVPV